MTLAAVFFFVSLATPVTDGMPLQTPSTAAPATAPPGKQEGATAAQKQTPASTTQPTKKPTPSSASAKRKRHKKKIDQPDCGSSAAAAQNSTGTAAADPASGQTSAPGSATQPPANCPPPKIIVQQGGTKEPSIQLAGGPNTDQAAQKRGAVSQLLETTDQNLKKAAGMQLSAEQQDTATQARQFIEQSKAALAAADLERAHTLAWKAELLSEDLLKLQK